MTRGTVPDPYTVIGNLRQANETLRRELQAATAKPNRAFRYGMFIGAAAMAAGIFAAEVVNGQTIEIGGIGYMGNKITPGSTVTITPSDKPGEWAIVVFENRLVNDGQDNGEYALTFEGVVIPTLFLWEADPLLGSDRITVIPPDGIICQPEDCGATVQEGAVGQIILFDWRGS